MAGWPTAPHPQPAVQAPKRGRAFVKPAWRGPTGLISERPILDAAVLPKPWEIERVMEREACHRSLERDSFEAHEAEVRNLQAYLGDQPRASQHSRSAPHQPAYQHFESSHQDHDEDLAVERRSVAAFLSAENRRDAERRHALVERQIRAAEAEAERERERIARIQEEHRERERQRIEAERREQERLALLEAERLELERLQLEDMREWEAWSQELLGFTNRISREVRVVGGYQCCEGQEPWLPCKDGDLLYATGYGYPHKDAVACVSFHQGVPYEGIILRSKLEPINPCEFTLEVDTSQGIPFGLNVYHDLEMGTLRVDEVHNNSVVANWNEYCLRKGSMRAIVRKRDSLLSLNGTTVPTKMVEEIVAWEQQGGKIQALVRRGDGEVCRPNNSSNWQ